MIKDKDTKNNKGNDKGNDKGMIKDKITMLYSPYILYSLYSVYSHKLNIFKNL